jgi:hypothetical protein
MVNVHTQRVLTCFVELSLTRYKYGEDAKLLRCEASYFSATSRVYVCCINFKYRISPNITRCFFFFGNSLQKCRGHPIFGAALCWGLYRISVSHTCAFNLLKPSGNFTYDQV